jgi:mannose-1-phosphate guanylyltransferase
VALRDPGAVMLVLPADQVIRPADAFAALMRRGVALADDRTLVTFGVAPSHAATGYGYIECGRRLDDAEPEARAVARFREKPDRATAEQFVAAGNFLWNSGIFAWSVAAIRAAMASSAPDLELATAGMLDGLRRRDAAAVAAAFRRAPKTSIDYAVMERAARVAVVRATVQWDDVGSFPALGAVGAADGDGNIAVLHGGAARIACESQRNVVYAEGRTTVALFGVRDLVVVVVGDAVMVCPKDRAGDLKTLVDRVRAEGRTDLL